MILYHAFSLIDSSRLLSGQNPENFVKVDWVCYLRDEPLIPYDQLIVDFQDALRTDKEKLWIQRRANYLLSLEHSQTKMRLRNLKVVYHNANNADSHVHIFL